jgi:hypothetical protein
MKDGVAGIFSRLVDKASRAEVKTDELARDINVIIQPLQRSNWLVSC